MIDICPVGALTSKPFRYAARTWELSRRKSVSPHDGTGANLIVQVKNHRVMRVVPFENEAVNECWIADRDRFSYEALNSADRLTRPMLKQGGEWKEVDWETALNYIANGVKQIRAEHGANSMGMLISPQATTEEAYLGAQLMRSLGSQNVDHRLRHAQFGPFEGVRWLGRSIASLSTLNGALVVGSNIRKEHPLFAQRVRQAARVGALVTGIVDSSQYRGEHAWAMNVGEVILAAPDAWLAQLAAVAAAVAQAKGVEAPASAQASDAATAAAQALLAGDETAILLGNAVAHHPDADSLLALANWIGGQTGASVGFLTEAGNTVGLQAVKALPGENGLNAAQMLGGDLKAVFLLNCEPEFDSAAGAQAAAALGRAEMVVTLSPFKANMAFSDVLLPIAPFTETSGTFVNAEGRVQSFHAVVRPLGETRPAWKVLRVLANVLELPGFDFQASTDVLAAALGSQSAGMLDAAQLSNRTNASVRPATPGASPVVAAIYQLDSLVRRAPALQATADARNAEGALPAGGAQ
jgi:NADH-quinone oxidoreductase subunit G